MPVLLPNTRLLLDLVKHKTSAVACTSNELWFRAPQLHLLILGSMKSDSASGVSRAMLTGALFICMYSAWGRYVGVI